MSTEFSQAMSCKYLHFDAGLVVFSSVLAFPSSTPRLMHLTFLNWKGWLCPPSHSESQDLSNALPRVSPQIWRAGNVLIFCKFSVEG